MATRSTTLSITHPFTCSLDPILISILLVPAPLIFFLFPLSSSFSSPFTLSSKHMNMLHLFHKWKTTTVPRPMCSQFLDYFFSCPSQWNREKLVKKGYLISQSSLEPCSLSLTSWSPLKTFFALITSYLLVSRFNALFSALIKLPLWNIRCP